MAITHGIVTPEQPADDNRPQWLAPRVTRMHAGQAELSPNPDTASDGPFTIS